MTAPLQRKDTMKIKDIMARAIKREPIANACGRGEYIEWRADNGTIYITFITEEELKQYGTH